MNNLYDIMINSENPLLTVITLTKNSSFFIERCINSLIKAIEISREKRIAHLVVDGYSTDDTINIIKSLSPNSTIIYRTPNGIYDAFNYSLYFVNSPYVMFLHSDDELDCYFLDIMFKMIKYYNFPNDCLFYGTVDFIDNHSKTLFHRYPPYFLDFIQKHCNLIFHPNAIYPTWIERKYPYDSSIGSNADHDHLNLITQKLKKIRVKKAVYKFRLWHESTTIKKCNNINFTSKICRYYLYFYENKLCRRLLWKLLKNKSYWNIWSSEPEDKSRSSFII